MSLVRAHNISVSLDGFSTGADQSLEAPFGHAGFIDASPAQALAAAKEAAARWAG
jgi:hypothetical protein